MKWWCRMQYFKFMTFFSASIFDIKFFANNINTYIQPDESVILPGKVLHITVITEWNGNEGMIQIIIMF